MMTSGSLTDTEIITLKVGATEAYSEKYGLPLDLVADLFLREGVYPYIRDNAELLSTKSYRFMASTIDEVFNLRK